jgi:uncharacterized protein (TIGR03000 family)
MSYPKSVKAASASGVLLGLTLLLGAAQGAPPGSYSGVYIGGNSGGYHSGDAGVYVGGYSGGYHRGYSGVYLGGYPEISDNHPSARYAEYSRFDFLPDTAARIQVRVPPDAEIWFQGQKMKQKGAFREFMSPPLASGKKYSYDIEIRWQNQGQEVVRKQTIQVHPGEWQSLNFTTPR